MNPLALSFSSSFLLSSFLLSSFPSFPLSLFPFFPFAAGWLGVPVLGSFDSGRQAFQVYHLFCFLFFGFSFSPFHGAMDGRVYKSTHRKNKKGLAMLCKLELSGAYIMGSTNGLAMAGDFNRRARALSLHNLLHILLSKKWPQIHQRTPNKQKKSLYRKRGSQYTAQVISVLSRRGWFIIAPTLF